MNNLNTQFSLSTITIDQICARADVAVYAPAARDVTPWVAANGVTVVAGEGGVGKTSMLMSQVVAPFTAGRPTVFSNDGWVSDPRDVIIVSVENSSAQLRDLLESAGADLHKIRIIGKLEFSNLTRQTDTAHLYSPFWTTIFGSGAGLVIIDPINKIVDVDSNKGRSVKESVMVPLTNAAAANGVAVIVTCHTRKSAGSSVRDALKGSTEYYDYADSVIYAQCGLNENGDDRNVLIVSEDKCRHDRTHGSVILGRENEGQTVYYRLISRTTESAGYYLESKMRAQFVRLHSVKSNIAEDRHEAIANEIMKLLEKAKSDGMHVRDVKATVSETLHVSESTIEKVKRELLANKKIVSKQYYRDAKLWLPQYAPADEGANDQVCHQ